MKEVARMEARDLTNLKQQLAQQSDKVRYDNVLKNAEFNRDVKRQFNRYKREMRQRQKRIEEQVIEEQQEITGAEPQKSESS